jgi:hypothetical protein
MKRRNFLKGFLGLAIAPFVPVPKSEAVPDVTATQKAVRDGFFEDLEKMTITKYDDQDIVWFTFRNSQGEWVQIKNTKWMEPFDIDIWIKKDQKARIR